MFRGRTDKFTLLLAAEPREFTDCASSANNRVPHASIGLIWQSRAQDLLESMRALLSAPAPRSFAGEPYFRDCWVKVRAPREAFAAALVWHAVWILLLIPLWKIAVVRPTVIEPRTQITWYGNVNDLPLIFPAAPAQPPARTNERMKTVSKSALPAVADTFHPRQTILNAPIRPNHPRQTLIQPAASPEPPKILPSLPNIVAWNAPNPAAMHIDAETLARLKPRAAPARVRQEVAAPDIANGDHPPGSINVAEASTPVKRPALQVAAMSAPRRQAQSDSPEPVPDLAASNLTASLSTNVIALSATPAPVAPPEIPAGNLASRLAISPQGSAPGAPTGSADAPTARAGNGPAGLSISGGGPEKSNVAGLGGVPGQGGPAAPVMPGIASVEPGTAAAAPRRAPGAEPARANPNVAGPTHANPMIARIKPGIAPEALLGPKRIYTLHVNMPNLTSATGSWVLSFAELAASDSSAAADAGSRPQAFGANNPADLQGPEPLRKVDPKYPPQLRDGHVQGEVVLYAVIRSDGTVDSIQLVTGVDSALDANAMQALAQWKFRPAERKGAPVDLEAIVHIPFRASAPQN